MEPVSLCLQIVTFRNVAETRIQANLQPLQGSEPHHEAIPVPTGAAVWKSLMGSASASFKAILQGLSGSAGTAVNDPIPLHWLVDNCIPTMSSKIPISYGLQNPNKNQRYNPL